MGLTRATETMSLRQAREGLTNYLLPSTDGGWRDTYRSGWLPSFFNQQWGGAQWGTEMQDAATGVTYKFDVATGSIEDNTNNPIGDIAGRYYVSQGFKVSESFTVDSLWLKIYKAGNTTATLTVRIYSDTAGSPGAALGSAVTLNPKTITSKVDGEWCRFSGFNCAVTAGTQYHIVTTMSATDGGNCYQWKSTSTKKYPFGNQNVGTSTPAWTPTTTIAYCFLVESPITNAYLQASGLFDKKLVFNEGTPLNQSKSLTQPMKNFFDGAQFTYLVRGKDFTKNKPICDFVYGLDHDRISLIPDVTTGFGALRFYDKAGTVFTVNGTTDLSTSTNKDIAIIARTKGDSGDYIQLWVNGAKQGEITGQALNIDPLFRDLGTAWLGGGFPAAPTWTIGSLSTFASLPSANGWTWVGTATEANAMSVSNNKLFQNKNGYASTDTGYYRKDSVGFSNATGWTFSWKCKVLNEPNSLNISTTPIYISITDGTKALVVGLHEYFLTTGGGASNDFTVQGDFKSQEHTFIVSGKGSDYYLWVDGKLVVDGTTKLTTASATNIIYIGDNNTTAGENADAIYSYIKYYTGGMISPQASTGASISETAYWSGDKSKLLVDLVGAGTPISVKTYCGLSRGYIGEGVIQREVRRGISSAPTTASTTYVLIPDQESFIIGSDIGVNAEVDMSNSAGAYNTVSLDIDGSIPSPIMYSNPGTAAVVKYVNTFKGSKNIGLHKVIQKALTASGTITFTGVDRTITVEAKS